MRFTRSDNSPREDEDCFLLVFTALGAIVPASLLAFNFPPSATFINQAVALLGWGIFLTTVSYCLIVPAARAPRGGGVDAGAVALMAGLALISIAALVTLGVGRSTLALVLSSLGMTLAAMLAVAIGVMAARSGQAQRVFHALAVALVVAGILSCIVSLIQVFAPSLAGSGDFIAIPAVEGRASGNLRQPNHLCSLLLWSLIGLVWLVERGGWRRGGVAPLALLFTFVLVLSASRTGWIGVAVLAMWGLLDRQMSRSARIGLVTTPLAYFLFWVGMTYGAELTNHVFYGQTRITGTHDISSSRYAIWSNTLGLIARHPWLGVGWGEFNFAWSLTPFPSRPAAFFDHTHNLELQFAVELGIPMALLLSGLFLYALWRSLVAALRAEGERASMLRAAFVLVLMMVIHSQLEYPLWYAYFLLPTALAFGLTLAEPTKEVDFVNQPAAAPALSNGVRPLLVAGSVALLLGGIASLVDYHRVVVVFAPPEDAPPLAQRIADGERSWFFAHHAYYAAATTLPAAEGLPSFANASHFLLDTRLMVTWAQALAANGQVDKARHIAARLREFANGDSVPFFEACDKAAPGDKELPFQCTPPSQAYTEADFR